MNTHTHKKNKIKMTLRQKKMANQISGRATSKAADSAAQLLFNKSSTNRSLFPKSKPFRNLEVLYLDKMKYFSDLKAILR